MRFGRWSMLVIAASLSLLAPACSSDDSERGPAPRDDRTVASSEPSEPSETYADSANWLCRPDIAHDACDVDLDATLVHLDGTTEPEPFEAATDATVDCFYVYPTISSDEGENSDLVADAPERGIVAAQAARFAEVCDVYAPMYRQIPLAALSKRLTGDSAGDAASDPSKDPQAGSDNGEGASDEEGVGDPDDAQDEGALGGSPGEIAYGDVREAFMHYLAEYNRGRPFVLIGHSQGAAHLGRLVAEEIDHNDDVRALMSSAMLIGGAIAASGEGAYDNVAACENPTDTGCVISYASFYQGEPPPPDSLFGRVRGESDGRAICTNPGDPASDSVVPLESYFGADHAVGAPAVDTPFIHYDGLVTGRCTSDDTFDWLEIAVASDGRAGLPSDLGGRITPQWGAHLSDVNFAQGDLIELVRSQNGLD